MPCTIRAGAVPNDARPRPRRRGRILFWRPGVRRLIINADDFGLAPCVTRGILHAHTRGLVTSATLMPNMPGFAHAVQEARNTPTLGIGIHLNLIRGRPLTPHAESAPLVGAEEGFLPTRKAIRRAARSGAYLAAAAVEYRAQIRRVLEHGIEPTHVDFEKHHVLASRALWRVAMRVAGEFGLPMRGYHVPVGFLLCRLPWCGWGGWGQAWAMRCRWQTRPRGGAPRVPDYFFGQSRICRVDEAYLKALLRHVPEGVSELMVHPGDYDAGELAALAPEIGSSYAHALRPLERDALCAAEVLQGAAASGVERVTFAALCGGA